MKTYDPGQIVATLGALVLTPGFGPDSFLTFEPAETLFTTQVGASGEVVRSRSRNRTGTVRIGVMQSSIVNDQLSAIAAADQLSNSGVLPFQVKDLNGTTLLSAKNAWIEERPHTEFSKEAGVREWVIAGEEWVEFHGGATP
jgi:hypothetical protein